MTIARPLALSGIAVAALLLVAGCTTSSGTSTAPETDETVASPCPAVPDGTSWGDAVPFRENEDEVGVYCQTTINPEASILVFDPSTVDLPSVEAAGFTIEDAEALLPSAARFVAEEVMDSTLLLEVDNDPEAVAAWVEDNRALFDDWVEDFDLTDAEYPRMVYASPLVHEARDGTPRLEETKFIDVAIAGDASSTVPVLWFEFNVEVVYPISDQDAVDGILAFRQGQGEDIDLAGLQAELPEVGFGNGEVKGFLVTMTYRVEYDSAGLIFGYERTFNTTTEISALD